MSKIKYKNFFIESNSINETPQADKLFKLKKSYEELSRQYAEAQKRGKENVADSIYNRMEKTLDAIEKLEKK